MEDDEKELEHSSIQEKLDKELKELDRKLEQKEDRKLEQKEALQVALEAISSFLAACTTELEMTTYHALDELTSKKESTYKGKKFNVICHCFGYQARGSLPSKFDCDYAYFLGHICYHILATGFNGYMATITNLKNTLNKW